MAESLLIRFRLTSEHGDCWRSLKTDHLCSLKIDQGWKPREGSFGLVGV